ncbi:MAG: YeeE/YedE family protein [Proteobacteria bacterium]|nr:YeeE/YedE family protein [Pseudomonadota bacterium]
MSPLEAIPIWRSIAGGALIGAGAALLMLLNGEVAGISGILERALHGEGGEQRWRYAFLAGLVLPAILAGPGSVDWTASLPTVAVAGLLVGVGTRLGSGCTSGHGVCGLSALSPRSLVATATFILTAVATVLALRAWSPP